MIIPKEMKEIFVKYIKRLGPSQRKKLNVTCLYLGERGDQVGPPALPVLPAPAFSICL